MIIDSHVHLLPARLAAKIRRFFEERGAPPLLYPYAPDAARQALVSAGIGRCWTLPYAHRGGVASGLNRWMAETFLNDPFVVPGATVHPDDDVRGVVSEATHLELPVFKLHCSVGAFAPDDPRLDPLWAAVSEGGQPVVVHGGSAPEGTASPGEVAAIGRAAERWPDARIIVAHFGSPSERDTLDLLARSRSVFADTTPVVANPIRVSGKEIRGFEDRILFGSDTPTVAVTIEDSLARVRGWGLSPADEALILGGNAERLVPGARVVARRAAGPAGL